MAIASVSCSAKWHSRMGYHLMKVDYVYHFDLFYRREAVLYFICYVSP